MKKALHIIVAILTIFAIVGCDVTMDRLQDQIVPEAPSTAAKTIVLTLKLPESYEVGSNAYYSYNLTSELKDSVNTLPRSYTPVRVETGHVAKVSITNVPEGTWYGYVTVGKSSTDTSAVRQYVNGLVITSDTYAEATLDFNRTSAPVAGYSYEFGKTTVKLSAAGTIYYTTDGSNPTTASTEYGPLQKYNGIVLEENSTVKAIAVAEGTGTSTVYTGNFNVYESIGAPAFGALVFDGNGKANMKLVLPETLKNSDSVYYTTDGSEPVPGNSNTSRYVADAGISYAERESGEGKITVKTYGPANSDGSYNISSEAQTLAVYQPAAPVFGFLVTTAGSDKGTVSATADSLATNSSDKAFGIFYSTTDDPLTASDREFVTGHSLNKEFEKGDVVFARSAVVTLAADGSVAAIHEWSAMSTFYTDSIAEVPEIGVVVADDAEATTGTITVPATLSGSNYSLYYTTDGTDPYESSKPEVEAVNGESITISVDAGVNSLKARFVKLDKNGNVIAWSPLATMAVNLVEAPEISSSEPADNLYTVTISSAEGTILYVNGEAIDGNSIVREGIGIGTDFEAYAAIVSDGKIIAKSAVVEERIGAPAPAVLSDIVLQLEEKVGNVSITEVDGVTFNYAWSDNAISAEALLTTTYTGDIAVPVGQTLTVVASVEGADGKPVYSRLVSVKVEDLAGPVFGIVQMTSDTEGSINVTPSARATETKYSVNEDFDPRNPDAGQTNSTFSDGDTVMYARSKVGNTWTVSKTDIISVNRPDLRVFYLDDNADTARQEVTSDFSREGFGYKIVYTLDGSDPLVNSPEAEDGVITKITKDNNAKAMVVVSDSTGKIVALSDVVEDTVDFDINPSWTSDFSDYTNETVTITPVKPAADKTGTIYWTQEQYNDLTSPEDLAKANDSAYAENLDTNAVIYARFVLKDGSDKILGYSQKIEMSKYYLGQTISVDGNDVVVFNLGDYSYDSTNFKAMGALKNNPSTIYQWGKDADYQEMAYTGIGDGIKNSNSCWVNDDSSELYKAPSGEGHHTIWEALKNFRNAISDEDVQSLWFIPSKDELDVLYEFRSELTFSGIYWSSSQFNDRRAWQTTFNGDKKTEDNGKNGSRYITFCRALQ